MNKIVNNNHFCNNCGKQGHMYHQCKIPITSYGIILFRFVANDYNLGLNEVSDFEVNSGVLNENINDASFLNNTCNLDEIEFDINEIKESENIKNIEEPILKKIKGKIEFLMIRRKDSFGYIDLMRGKYMPYNIEQIKKCIDQMSNIEKSLLLSESFDYLWKSMWGGDNKASQYQNEEIISSKKFDTIKNGFTINDNFFSLEKIVESSDTSWKETEWEFPKGRRNYQEKDLECALREFEEETGYSKESINVIENLFPFEETFVGSNQKSYKNKYYLAYIQNSVSIKNNLENYQKSEVSKIEWKTYEECLDSIRPYHLEKKQLITNIYKLLQKYRLFS